jgi:hypothetical protein
VERARLALSVAWLALACRGDRDRPAFPVPGEGAPHVTVEVLNASARLGVARLGTRVLREAGIDVVSVGNARAESTPLDSTRIVVRRGSAAVGARVRRALGVGQVLIALDSTRLLDASVFLGLDFRPRGDFHP